jgi:hypothetical protein
LGRRWENYDAQIGFSCRDRDGRGGLFGCPNIGQVVSGKEPVRIFGQSACGDWKAAHAWERSRRQPQAYAAGGATLCGGRDLPALLDVQSHTVGKRSILNEGQDLRLAPVGRAAILGLALTSTEAHTAEAEARLKPVCLNAAETRYEVKAHKLLEPFVALKTAAAQRKAEALSAVCVGFFAFPAVPNRVDRCRGYKSRRRPVHSQA